MSKGLLCERCCEQVAGVPPEVDWKGVLLQHLETAWVIAAKFFYAVIRIIGFACFFAVAIWFQPIRSLTAADQRRIQEARARLQREEEDKRRREEAEAYDRERDNAFHRNRIDGLVSDNNEDLACARGLINSTRYIDGKRRAGDQYLLDHLDGIGSDFNNDLTNPDLALIQHSRDLQEAKRNILDEHIKDQERQRLREKMDRLDMEISRQEMQPDQDGWRQAQELSYLRDRRADAQWQHDRLI